MARLSFRPGHQGLEFQRKWSPTRAALLSLWVVDHAERCFDQLLMVVYSAATDKLQRLFVHNHLGTFSLKHTEEITTKVYKSYKNTCDTFISFNVFCVILFFISIIIIKMHITVQNIVYLKKQFLDGFNFPFSANIFHFYLTLSLQKIC